MNDQNFNTCQYPLRQYQISAVQKKRQVKMIHNCGQTITSMFMTHSIFFLQSLSDWSRQKNNLKGQPKIQALYYISSKSQRLLSKPCATQMFYGKMTE